ncbi:MAG: RimK/LysX family protein [Verrucomicrobiae bacterium]|nr:RimK/LysX family protein [Verrucomicrobiae bacterium]
MSEPIVIGWKETIDLPDWGVFHIVAKADTGARSSALDVKNIRELPDNRVQFEIVLDRKDRSKTKTIVAPISHQKHVRSSNGQEHERYFVKTNVQLGTRIKEVEFSLVCRKAMVCRVLLGRRALNQDFLVDSSDKYRARPRRAVKTR